MPSDLSSFEEFCGNSPFWNKTLLLDSSYPTFTECFKQVALQWIPCLLFLILTPLYVRHKWWQKDDPLAIGFLSVGKTMCSIALLGVTITTLIVRANDDDQDSIPDALYVSEGLKIASFIVTTFLIQLDRRKGSVVSPMLWFLYLVLLLGSIIPFYSNIEEDLQDDDKFGYVIFYVYFGFLSVSLLLCSFAERRNKSSFDATTNGNPTPELDASMPSLLSLWWLTNLVYNGFKKSLEEKDVFDLNPIDRSENHTPTFEKKWEAELAKVRRYNEGIRRLPSHFYSSKSSFSFERKLDEKSPLLPPEEKTKEKSPYRKASLMRVLMKTYGPMFLFVQLVRTAFDLLQFMTPKITESILDYIVFKPMYHEWRGYCLAGSYAVILTISAIGSNCATYLARRIGINVKGVLMNAIYKKSLTVSSIGDDSSSGEMINLLANDCQKVEEVSPWIYFFIAAPFQISLAIYMLYDQMEEATFAGMGVLFLILPINAVIGLSLGKNQILQMQYKDERMKMTTEVINGVKVLKLYAWEGSFEEKITEIRNKELNAVKQMQLAISLIYLIFSSIPIMVQLTSFAVYIAISDDGYLSPTVASVSIQLFNLLNIPLTVMPVVFPFVVQSYVSVGRINEYLNKEDIDPTVVQQNKDAENAIEIVDGEFTWDHSQQPTLQDINVTIKPGSLVAVVGTVGCGKSSLLSAMMGEMFKLNGTVTLKESIAYVPQEAWIQNATVRDNILFGSKYDRLKYNKIIRACSLKSDLDILPGGDQTEIGEKGINISGGQKQRVSLARAIYSDNNIYLLDDPLSAVDSHVGKHIFKHVISSRGVLKNKTRILVTHGIHWLPLVDNIIVMKDGRISEVGTYEDLLSTNGVLAQFLQEHIQETMESEMEDQTDPEVEIMRRTVLRRVESVTGSAKEGTSSGEDLGVLSDSKLPRSRKQSQSGRPHRKASTRRRSSIAALETGVFGTTISEPETSTTLHRASITAGAKLIEEEREGSGKVKWETYWYYLKAAGKNTLAAGILLYLANAGARFFTGVWLSDWTSDDLLLNTSRSDEDEYDETTNRYMGVYGAAGLSQGIFTLIFAILSAVQLTKASGILHNRMLSNILRLPMTFFDTTPGGRIINRFSRDVDILDVTFPTSLKQILDCISQILGTVLTISYGTPSFLIALGPLAFLYILVMVLYVPTSRQLRRLEAVTRSPLLAHFAETLSGSSSIRAYKSQDRFLKESRRKVDNNLKFYFAGVAAQVWVILRLQLLSGMVTFAAAIFSVADTDVGPSKAGVSISYATQLTGALQVLVDNVSQTESNIVSVERLKEYAEEKREADWINPKHRPRSKWPQAGNIIFQNYQTRYRPGLDYVLKDITCNIKGGERIGIVGRTGAGKSSLTVALFRLIESAGGQIIIDDEPISSLGLHDLRSKLTILPQEPVIFSGSLRMNLDPFDKASDKAIWDALEHSHLKEFVKGLPNGLQYECGEGGSNLSVGQRQLVCLGRTLLRKTKVLVLDEATAAVDMETDELIQQTIRKEFKDSTVLTIAHRLNTIMDYDRIMVLDNGFLSEFDSPSNLLSNKATIFYGMARDAGLVT